MLVTDTDTVSSLKRCLRKVTTFSLPANFASEINGGRLTPMSGLQAPEGGLCLHGPSGVIDIEHYQINMRLHLYLNRRSLWLGKQSDVRGLRQMCGI